MGLKRKFITFTSPRDGVTECHLEPQGKHQVLVRWQKAGARKCLSQSLYWGLYEKGKAEQGKHFRTG